MKIIFLDIDGVLNVEHYINAVYSIYLRDGIDPQPHMRDKYGNHFCPTVINKLNWIIEATNAKIVISSTWRGWGEEGLLNMQNMWKDRNLPGEVIDITPHRKHRNEDFYVEKKRGHEIQRWLDTHEDIEAYVIIDDDNDMLDEQQKFMIHVDAQYGIMTKDAQKIIEILCPN